MNSFTPSSSRTAPLNKDITPSFVILLHVPRFALIWVSLGDKGNSSKVKVERAEKRKSINTYGSLMSIGKWYWIGNMWTTDSSKTLSRWMKIEKTKKVENLLKKNSVKVFLLCIRHFLFSLFFFLLSFPRFLLLLRKFLIRVVKLFHLILIIFIFRLLFGKNNFVNNWEKYNVHIAIAIVMNLNFFSSSSLFLSRCVVNAKKRLLLFCSAFESGSVLFLKAHKPTSRTVEQGERHLNYPPSHRMHCNYPQPLAQANPAQSINYSKWTNGSSVPFSITFTGILACCWCWCGNYCWLTPFSGSARKSRYQNWTARC